MLVPFRSAEKACEAVSAVFREGLLPSAMEFMERDAIDWALKNLDDISVSVPGRALERLAGWQRTVLPPVPTGQRRTRRRGKS